jgi:CIC family chloride channel protein
MRRDPAVIASDAPLGELRRSYPAGSTKRLFVVDGKGAFMGVIDSPALYTGPAAQDDAMKAGALAQPQMPLVPGLSVRAALERFEEQEVEALAVIDRVETRQVVGYLTEAYAHRRYRHALEDQRRNELGDSDVFGPPTAR